MKLFACTRHAVRALPIAAAHEVKRSQYYSRYDEHLEGAPLIKYHLTVGWVSIAKGVPEG